MPLERIPPLSRFERSPITNLLLNRILAAEVNEVIPYQELSEIAGDNVQEGSRHLLGSARGILLHKHGIPTDAVTRIGIKRVDDQGAIDIASGVVKHVYRATKRGMLNLSAVKELANLDEGYQRRYHLNRIVLGCGRVFSSSRIENRLLAKAADPKALPSLKQIEKRTLEIFS